MKPPRKFPPRAKRTTNRKHGATWTGLPPSQSDRLIAAAAEFVSSFRPWSHFITLSFVTTVSDQVAKGSFDRFVQSLRDSAQGHVFYAVAEGRQADETLHFHLLIELEDPSTVVPAWRDATRGQGSADVQQPRSRVDVARYLTLHDSWDITVACPRPSRCRRTRVGCVEWVRHIAARH